MAKPRSKPSDAVRDAEGLLRRQPVRAAELVAAIHAVNPTGLNLPGVEERHRYGLKSKLQSRLILEFFEDLEFESTDQPGLIGLRYRPQDRDAAHAVLAELEVEARSKVQLHLDTHEPRPAKVSAPGTKTSSAPQRAGRLAEGKRALDEYDYDTARGCFEEALLESDDDAAAVALLEVLVDQFASWQEAMDLEPRLSPSQHSTAVRALLAVAAAQLGNAAAFHRLAKDGKSPRFAGALCILVTQCLQRGDFAGAAELLTAARVFEPGSPEVIAAEGELTRLKAAQRGPAERELELLLSSGEALAAEEKARSILARYPESGPARRAVREAEAKDRDARLATLQQQAQSACDREDDVAALALWSQALELGAEGLEKAMTAASARIEARRRQRELSEVVARLRSGPTEKALTGYLALDVAARREVRQETGKQVLEWLEQLGPGAQREWPMNLAAVLALGVATHSPVSERLALLAPHEDRVRRIEHGRTLLAQAEAQAEREALEKDFEQLEVARAAFSAGRWREAVSLAQGHHPREHRDPWRRLADEALARLESDARVLKFEALLSAGDTLAALAVLQAAEFDEASDQELWAGKRRTLSPRLRQHFEVQVGDAPDAVSACDFANVGLISAPSYALDGSAEFAYWATALGPGLFIRKISLRDQRVVLMVALTTPQPFSIVDAQVEGETLWVISEGAALLLSTRTWDVLRWHGVTHVAEGEVLEAAAIVPGGRFQWLSIRKRTGSDDDLLRVIDLERGKVLRETEREGLNIGLVVTEQGPRVWLTGYRRAGRLFEPGGATDATLPVGVQAVSIAPMGSGLIAARGQADPDPDDEDTEGEALQVLHLRAAGAAPELVEELTDSDSESMVLVATALEAKASFVQYSGYDGLNWLVAYTEEGGFVRRRWRVRCPQPCLLLQNLQARHVVLVAARGSGLRCLLLGVDPPDLDELLGGLDTPAIPRLSEFSLSCSPWFNESLMTVAERLSRLGPPERQRSLAGLLEEHGDRPDDLAFLASELSWRMPSEAAQVLAMVRQRFPGHVSTTIEQADLALKTSDWQGALDALGPARGTPAASRAGTHVEHLRGMALYHLDRLGEAREAFSLGLTAEDSGCHMEGWPEWIDALMGREVKGKAGQLLAILRDARAALAEGRGHAALTLLDVPLVWGSFDVQLGAQLAVAAHDSNVAESGGRMRARFIVAAFLEQLEQKHAAALPLGPLALSPEKLAEVAGLVRGWLEGTLRG